MKIEQNFEKIAAFQHLELLANQIVEGFINGMHKSPFHGFSSEFAEHKLYNKGESTRHIDWKLFAKTDRLYTKRYEEETNLRCHFIIDNSSSMHYPKLRDDQPFYQSKAGFAILATAVLMNLLKRQRDAVGLSLFSDQYDYYAPEKGSDRHHRMILNVLEETLQSGAERKQTNTPKILHEIAEKLHRRSMVVLFTDLFQLSTDEKLITALQHLRHNKHRVIVFHVFDKQTEIDFDFDTTPRKFIDLETGDEINLFAEQFRTEYKSKVEKKFKELASSAAQNKIRYVPVNVADSFEQILTTYLVEKQKFG